ncbi:hypothetical protein GGI04_000601 [Coemansia thaxteri]|nr:hypothetical protein GGI04_000601 [Coemansia thaxteri]
MQYPSGAPASASGPPQQQHPVAGSSRSADSGSASAAAGTPEQQQQQQKKKRLTQACQHCRKKKIRCDGIRPSCNNCSKSKSPCTYLPSVRKRGRNSLRVAMLPTYASSAGGPYARALHQPPQHAPARQQPHPQPQHVLGPQPMMHIGHHGMPPPPPPPPPHINPLGVSFVDGGPVSLHLKRDPGFGHDPAEEALYDPAKAAYEASSHFMLPVNNFHYSSYAPPRQPPSSMRPQAGPSSGSGSSSRPGPSKPMGIPGTSCFPMRTPSGSSMGYGVDIFPSTSGIAALAQQPPAGAPMPPPATFDPTVLAQDLSSAYVSVLAGLPPATPGAAAAAAASRSAVARGKSASHAPSAGSSAAAALDPGTTTKMRDLRKQIRAIISSVWADTECGKSAGMAGVSMADDEPSRDDGAGGSQLAQAPQALASPSGDRAMDDHLLSIFFESVHHQLPIIQRADFARAYERGAVPPLLVSAMCAAASVFLNRIEDERRAIYDRYALKVRELFHDACFAPSLEVVQTALIMTLCEYRLGSLHRAWVYLCKPMGFRLAIAMGYHHHDSKLRASPMQTSADIAHRESCRRAFWGAFLLDRYTAIGGGKPLGINDNDICVLLPLRDVDWLNPAAPPPLSALEFFRPTSLSLSPKSTPDSGSSAAAAAANASGDLEMQPACVETDDSSTSSRSNNSSPRALTRNCSPVSAASGWDSRAGETSALGCFIKLMAVVGQVAQNINGAKGSSRGGGSTGGGLLDQRPDHPSRDYAALDAALLRWKEELPPSLQYSAAKSLSTEPEAAVFVACMHAIYHGAVIMLNRENMGLLRDLPGQLDVSTNLAIRSLERCRVAAMEIVEIAHHLCSLPSAMTNALLPWAMFQAGTLLIHFMIAGSSPHAQEEARSAILSLDSALRDELSRYWNVSSKYHLVLSNMVKAWERTRQSTPSLTPRQPPALGTPTSAMLPLHSASSGSGSGFGDSAADTYQALNAQVSLPMQMQMHMQLPPTFAHTQPSHLSQPESSFSTLLKPYNAPLSQPGSLPTPEAHSGMLSMHQSTQQPMVAAEPVPSFMFTPDSAQDSINTLNAFLSQLSQEQARQISEGLQTYSLQNAGAQVIRPQQQQQPPSSGAGANGSHPVFGVSTASDVMLANAAAMQQIHTFAPAAFDVSMSASVNPNRLQIRRGSLPISSNGDLFTAPGARTVFPTATVPPPYMQPQQQQQSMLNSEQMLSSELDPLLFNPMTPFLQELQLLNSLPMHHQPSAQQQASQQQVQGTAMSAGGPGTSVSGPLLQPNGRLRK